MTETFLEALTPTAPPAAAKAKPAPKNSYWEGRKAAVYLYVCKLLCQKYGPDSGTVIDVGSNGTPTLEWHRKWATRMVSLDLVRPYRAEAVESLKQDFFKFEPTEQFDLVTCFQVLEHVPDPQVFAQKLLSIGKVLVVSVPYKWRAGACKHHIHDPVDEEKMFAWFGRKPDYSYVARELNNVERMIQVYVRPDAKEKAAEPPRRLAPAAASTLGRAAIDPALRFARGFLLGPARGLIPPTYRAVDFPVPLRINSNTHIGVARGGAGAVAVLGEALDPNAPLLDHDGVARMLLAAGSRRQAEIDRLVGRFAVITAAPDGEVEVQTDAIGLRSVYYTIVDGAVVAGGHAKLVAEAAGPRPMLAAPRPIRLGYPGMDTPHPGIWRLPANVALSMRSGRLRRFFPIQAIEPVTVEDMWSFALDQAGRAIEALRHRASVLVSLTAGLDSRTTLAAARASWPHLRFFTYLQQGERRAHDEIDLAVSRDLTRLLGLAQEVVDLKGYRADPALAALQADNAFTSHVGNLSCAYHDRFGSGRHVHVRTNLLELGRSNLFANNRKTPQFAAGPSTGQRMAEFYAAKAELPVDAGMLDAFGRYVGETSFDRALAFASPWDLYFVEHRMGAWQGGVASLSDLAFDTIIAFNSREVVRRMMGVPQEVRSTSGHLIERLARVLPEVAHVPINPNRYPPSGA
jgi:hypothetical protein